MKFVLNDRQKVIIENLILLIIILILFVIILYTNKKEYKVIFLTNSDTTIASKLVKEGDKIEQPDNIYREGYTFKGWYLNDQEFDFNSSITANITLEAHWERENDNS